MEDAPADAVPRKLLRATPSIVAVMTPSGVPVIDPCHSKSTSSLTFSATKRTENPSSCAVQLVAEETWARSCPSCGRGSRRRAEARRCPRQPHVAQVTAFQNRSQRSRPQVCRVEAAARPCRTGSPLPETPPVPFAPRSCHSVSPLVLSQSAFLGRAGIDHVLRRSRRGRASPGAARAADRICVSIASSAAHPARERPRRWGHARHTRCRDAPRRSPARSRPAAAPGCWRAHRASAEFRAVSASLR